MAQARCREAGTQLFICTAYDTFQDRRLTLAERFLDRVSNWDEALMERSSRLYSMNEKRHSHPWRQL
ncbi:hypothetical protein AZE42_13776 [Rhizopogon vesiculosus]|uniref:Uncharacterized protein n=1 Tax=Rhizopogon vesiculosus TaxID=180088 RepID=A0A1J8PKN7_9AGAM|nr:hypothetical protein AZE42_13776 [Rhizopogon vesiculosus]